MSAADKIKTYYQDITNDDMVEFPNGYWCAITEVREVVQGLEDRLEEARKLLHEAVEWSSYPHEQAEFGYRYCCDVPDFRPHKPECKFGQWLALPEQARCRAARDGECYWEHCPQIRDGEPSKSGRHCPLDHIDPEE